MAVYQYKCNQCETNIDIKRDMNEKDHGYKCSTCNSDLIRVYSLGAVTFNGSGFYSKDK
jgi:putative FmdB family regulatory protein